MDVTLLLLAHLQWLRARFESQRGAHLVEYGLLVGLIAIVALAAVKLFGQGVSTQFSTITSEVTN
jgi:pilus assembly protein Flp/PilA